MTSSVLWESATANAAEVTAKEIEFIRKYRSNDPIADNRRPRFQPDEPNEREPRGLD